MIPSDPLYAQQWHFDHLGNIEKIWDEYSGAGIHVGVYDNGVESTHPDLAGNYDPGLHIELGGVPQSGDVDPEIQTDPIARGHGTAVAGLITAQANNGEGGVGVAWGASLTSVNIFEYLEYEPIGGVANLMSALQQMVKFDVTNNSWNRSPPHYDPADNLSDPGTYVSAQIAAYALASESGRGGLGTVIVQGIGNNNVDVQGVGLNSTRYTISVAGVGPDGFPAAYSNYGAAVLVTAPTKSAFGSGDDGQVTTDLTGTDGYNLDDNPGGPSAYTDRFGGTSGSGPIVTGVVALMLDANAGLGWRDVQNIIAASATHTGSDSGDLGNEAAHANENGEWFLNDATNWNGGGMHFSNDYGYGAVDAYAAVRMAEVWSLFTTAQTSANEQIWNDDDDTSYAIPDFGSGSLTASINLAPNPAIKVEHVEVTVELTHQDFRQLRIFLTAPSGTEVQLFDGSGGTDATADTLLSWTFAADALRGENAAGDWTLRIEDAVAGKIGTLSWFKVVVYGSLASANDVYHYTDEFLAMAALAVGGLARETLTDAGGADWIDAAAVTGNVALNLNAGGVTKVNGTTWFTIAGGTQIEHAVTGDGNDTLTGNGVANRLHGMRGNDALDGGLGNDLMFGGKGNDTYVVAQSGDVADETGGNGADTVKASITFSLADTVHAKGAIEHLTLTGASAINATGNGSANTLTGNGAANTLDGQGNNDLMRGMGGNDTYVVAQSADVVDETGGSGVDLVKSALTFSLVASSRLKGSVENLTLTGSAKIDATGSGLANLLLGNAGANVINGLAGNDTLTGGASADTFAFDTALNPTANVDRVTDFLSGVDTLRLDASVFTKLKLGDLSKKAFFAKDGASKARDKQDRVIYDSDSGEVRFDQDGKGKTKAVLFAVLDGAPDLAHTDVLVIA